MIYTSYFGALGKFKNDADLQPVSIARFSPKWYSGPKYSALAPSPEMMKMGYIEYTIKFFEILAKLDPRAAEEQLYELTQGKHPVLLCYEVYGHECATAQKTMAKAAHIGVVASSNEKTFCHRHFVARWFNNAGIPCEELLFEPKAALV